MPINLFRAPKPLLLIRRNLSSDNGFQLPRRQVLKLQRTAGVLVSSTTRNFTNARGTMACLTHGTRGTASRSFGSLPVKNTDYNLYVPPDRE